MVSETGTLYSVDELLSRSKAAAEAKAAGRGGTKIQQMIAQMEAAQDQDSVNLSPVAKMLKSQQSAAAARATPFTEQEWYINAKVAQLKAQIQMYSTLPGLDPSGGMMDSLTDEVNDLVTKQQAKLRKSQAEAAEKQAELDRLNAERANAPISVEDMLKRAKLKAEGKEIPTEISKEAQAMLDNSKGKVVNKTA